MNYKILINKDNPYDKKDFSNFLLVKVDEGVVLEKRTFRAYLDLKKRLEKDNIYIKVVSGYRSEEDQNKEREKYIENFGIEYANKYVALPGISEHHSGLCFDIALIIDGKEIKEEDYINNYHEIFAKIIELLPLYGLILRYPLGKEKITGYNYEPWHYRYVGKSTASIIMNKGLTLEEYDRLYNRSGVLLVNKPKGLTSRDVVNKVSLIFDTKKVGHNGTLDPLASGLLVITINKATKINELLTCEDKEYIAEVKVGILTDTLDLEGKVLDKKDEKITKEMLDVLFKKFPRKYLQTVPKYSAVKVNGKKLYEYARSDKEVVLPKREVVIKELELLDFTDTSFKFRCVVSKGTYIRSLIKDMGEFLGLYFTMSNLKRTRQGKFLLDNSFDIDNVTISSNLISIRDALDIPFREIKDNDYKKIINGASINNNYNVLDKVLFVNNNSDIAIYKEENGNLKCFKML